MGHADRRIRAEDEARGPDAGIVVEYQCPGVVDAGAVDRQRGGRDVDRARGEQLGASRDRDVGPTASAETP